MMCRRAIRQRELFDEGEVIPAPRLQEDVREEAMRLLTQWMAAVAKATGKEADDEQDQR
jgi:hypothetical protein